MRFPIPHTLQGRLVLSHLLVSLVSVTFIAAISGRVLYQSGRSQVEHHYEDLAFAASNNLEAPLADYIDSGSGLEPVQATLERFFPDTQEVHYTLYLKDGVPFLDSSGVLPPPADGTTAPEIWDAQQSVLGEGEIFRKNELGEDVFSLAVRVEHDSLIYAVLRLQIPMSTVLASARRSVLLLALAAALVALGMSAAGYLFARNLSNPIENLTQTAESLSKGDLGARTSTMAAPQELKQLAQAFNSMADRLQANVDEMRSFVANASHELRTPLTSVKLRVEALRDGALEDPGVSKQFLSEIESEVNRLSSMVNDLLDLSRIEAGMTPKQRVLLNLGTIASEVCATFAVRAERANVTLNCNIMNDLPALKGNEDQIRRVFYNLVDNAIKYTPRGGKVDIDAQVNNSRNVIRVTVSDTGFGIAADNLSHIFERFYRVEATRPRSGPPQGSGLGLPIARSIVETHGGKIGVSSKLGSGTTFWFELPVYDFE